ncbi:MAG: peptidylprolyl isomerase [bacterium]|nr:peptidylprolyl isomerase [bacterium]
MRKSLFLIIFSLLLVLPLAAEYYDGIFIIVDNDAITYNEFSVQYKKFKENLIKYGQPGPPNAKTVIFKKLVNEKIIRKIADKRQVFVGETEVTEALNNIKKMNRLTDDAFRQILAQEGKTVQELEKEYEQQILQEKIMSIELQPRIKFPEDIEIQSYYNNHKNDMYDPEKIRVSHILFRDNPNASLDERSKIKTKALNVLQMAQKGQDFGKLVEKYSDDSSSVKVAGDIGYVARKEWLQEIDDIIFKLKKGQIAANILQSRWGWHIVKVTDRQPKKLVPYQDMKSRIANYLVKEKMQLEYEKWFKEQMQNSYIEVIFPSEEKYVFDFDKWQKKNAKSSLSEEEFNVKINALKI